MKRIARSHTQNAKVSLAQTIFVTLIFLSIFHAPAFSDGFFLNDSGRGQAKDQKTLFFGGLFGGKEANDSASSNNSVSYQIRRPQTSYNPYQETAKKTKEGTTTTESGEVVIDYEKAIAENFRIASQNATEAANKAASTARAKIQQELRKVQLRKEQDQLKRSQTTTTTNTQKTYTQQQQQYVLKKITPYVPRKTFSERDDTSEETSEQNKKKTNRLFLSY